MYGRETRKALEKKGFRNIIIYFKVYVVDPWAENF